MQIVKEGLSYDDVLLIPGYSEIMNRVEVDLKSTVLRGVHSSYGIHLEIPIISANMDTITGMQMAQAMRKIGGAGIIHRFMPDDQFEKMVKATADNHAGNYIVSVGVGDKAPEMADFALNYGLGVAAVCIDVAHGDHKKVYDTIKAISKRKYSNVNKLIVGNIATPEAAVRLRELGVQTLKVGVGPGSLCTTRINTGCGVPQLTAIMDIREALNKLNVQTQIIADGGIKNSGDIVKALAAGADAVMIGGLLAGTDETPGEVIDGKKVYRGMASKEAQTDWKGEATNVEGETISVPVRGPVAEVIKPLVAGIKSGFSYVGAKNIDELRLKAKFMRITPAGYRESLPHGKV